MKTLLFNEVLRSFALKRKTCSRCCRSVDIFKREVFLNGRRMLRNRIDVTSIFFHFLKFHNRTGCVAASQLNYLSFRFISRLERMTSSLSSTSKRDWRRSSPVLMSLPFLVLSKATVATSRSAWRWMCDSPRTGCARTIAHLCTWSEQAMTEWSRRVISIVACCHSVSLCAHAARAFITDRNTAIE